MHAQQALAPDAAPLRFAAQVKRLPLACYLLIEKTWAHVGFQVKMGQNPRQKQVISPRRLHEPKRENNKPYAKRF
jgi:hypothetical protein